MTIANIKVTNPNNQVFWQKQLTETEYTEVAKCLTERSVDGVRGCFFPVRTNNLSNFSKDFFFPSTIHYAAKTGYVFKRVIEHVVLFFVDLITLPIRVLTCIPRVIYNAIQEKSPISIYLKKQNDVDSKLLQTDHLLIELKKDYWNSWNINLIEVPRSLVEPRLQLQKNRRST